MSNDTVSRKGSEEPAREPFATIDGAIELGEELVAKLKKLTEHKYPLRIRKASRVRREVVSVQEDRDSKQVRAGSRTYFIDVETMKDGKPYLRITVSRFKGKGSQRERNSIVVFREEANEFASAVSEMAAKL